MDFDRKNSKKNRSGEAGFSLLAVLIMSGVVGLIATATYQLLDHELDLIKIVRMHQRMDLLEKKIVNAGHSYGAMRRTAELNPGTRLAACFAGPLCQSQTSFEPLTLADALGQTLSGSYDLTGRACQGECPILIEVESRIQCADGAITCVQASEVQTRYAIKRSSARFFKGRDFKEVKGTASLSTFACGHDQYVRSITADGQILCDKAFASVNATSCPAGTAAFGLDSEGFIKCLEIFDYCRSPIGMATVLDTSASMRAGGTMGRAKTELAAFVNALRRNQDQSSFVVFNSRATIRNPLTSDIAAILTSIRAETPRSMTDMVSGIVSGAQTLSAYAGGKKVMVFVSDGFHNGTGDPIAAAETIKSQGIRLLTVGLSARADARILQMMASSPQDYFDATNTGNLKKMFDEIKSVTCR